MLNPDTLAALADPAIAARALEAVAATTGDTRFTHAAGILRGRPGGRLPRDDANSLERMKALIASGAADSPAEAARLVARTLQGVTASNNAAFRLAKKYRAMTNFVQN